MFEAAIAKPKTNQKNEKVFKKPERTEVASVVPSVIYNAKSIHIKPGTRSDLLLDLMERYKTRKM